jgi:hypothetical protein
VGHRRGRHACGAGLALRACATTARHFAVALGRPATQPLATCAVAGVPAVAVTLEVDGPRGVESLLTLLDDLPGLLEVATTELGRDAG